MRIVVVEDDPRYRQSVETFIEHTAGYALAGSFGSADAALREARDAPWDLVLMDVEMPGTNGIEATRRLKKLLPDVAIVILTVFEEPSVILQAIAAGADGYMLKKSSSRELRMQLDTIAAGGAPLTSGVARTVLELLRTGVTDGAADVAPARLTLTEREQQVLRNLVRGMSYRRAAEDLGISLDTVRTHIRAIYKKLQVHTVAEAVTRAVREGLI